VFLALIRNHHSCLHPATHPAATESSEGAADERANKQPRGETAGDPEDACADQAAAEATADPTEAADPDNEDRADATCPNGVPHTAPGAMRQDGAPGSDTGDGESATDKPDTGAGEPTDRIPAEASPRAADTRGGRAGTDESASRSHTHDGHREHRDDDDRRAAAAGIAGALHRQLSELTGGLGRDTRAHAGQTVLIAEAASRMSDALADLKSRWCYTGTDQNGKQQHGAAAYRPPAAMRRMVQQRDGTCRFPGCRKRAAMCDADHTIAYHQGGQTCPCNLASLCRRHHRLKQRPEWQLHHIWPSVLVWIAPTGHWYITGPDG
jgi:hypothetical protein